MDSRDSVTDRFYSALYKKLLEPGLTASSKQVLFGTLLHLTLHNCTLLQVMFLNLLYKAVKADQSPNRVKAFIKRLIQVATFSFLLEVSKQ